MNNYQDKHFTGIIIIIYSCVKNVKKATLLYNLIKELISNDLKIFILNGIETLETEFKFEDKFLYLKCKDNYDNLFLKTHKLFSNIIEIFPNLYGVFKMDDDIIPNNVAIKQMSAFVKGNSSVNYCGYASAISSPRLTNWHINKCEEPKNRRQYIIPRCVYCTGPCYYLSKKAIKYFNKKNFNFFAEDIMVGYSFFNSYINACVYLSYSNDKKLKWLTNIENTIDNKNRGNLIFIKLHGGLGNQLFQVAAGLSYCKKNNSLPVLIFLDDKNEKKYYPHSDIKNILIKVFYKFNKLSINNFDNDYVLLNPEISFIDSYKHLILPPPSNKDVLMYGYFQNFKYFDDNKEELREVFLNENIRDGIKEKYEDINNNFFIHLRRGDYVGNKLYEIDYDSYYTKAIQNFLNDKLEIKEFYVFSNDLEYCKTYQVFEKFKEQVKFIFMEELDEIESFYFMTLCRGGITCNSSYSWWASYLNDTEDKKIIIPKIWMPNTNIDMSFENVITI